VIDDFIEVITRKWQPLEEQLVECDP
jgi:hypothetical protein